MTSADPSAARRYHERTKHSFQSVRASPHFLDWDIMPRPFKVYPDLEPISLPRDVTTSTRPALAAIADPGTATGTGPRLDRAALARLFYFSAGVLRRTTYPGGEMFYRAAACTGALYHIDLYLACGPLPDLDPGVYHFGPHDFALRRLRAGDHRETVIRATGREPAATAAPAGVLFTSTFWRNSWKYQARAYRHCFWDSGTILAHLPGPAAAACPVARRSACFTGVGRRGRRPRADRDRDPPAWVDARLQPRAAPLRPALGDHADHHARRSGRLHRTGRGAHRPVPHRQRRRGTPVGHVHLRPRARRTGPLAGGHLPARGRLSRPRAEPGRRGRARPVLARPPRPRARALRQPRVPRRPARGGDR